MGQQVPLDQQCPGPQSSPIQDCHSTPAAPTGLYPPSYSPFSCQQSPLNQPLSGEQSPLAEPSPLNQHKLPDQRSPVRSTLQDNVSSEKLPDTPRKQGTFTTPPKKVLTRKKVARPETWRKNVRKTLRLQGKAYMSETGKPIAAKQQKDVDCSKCRLKCNRLKDRQREIFDLFYSLDTYEKQKQFVCSHVTEKGTKTFHDDELDKACPKKRQVCRQFYVTVDGQRERVCKNFFLSTLAVSNHYLEHALQNSQNGMYVRTAESRGNTRPHNKTPDAAVENVKRHIRSFPVVPSHYTRKDTQREYLASDLNIKKMHELYTEECEKEGTKPVSSRQYRKIFNENFNLSFHVPKKDQCSTCSIYAMKKTGGSVDEKEEELYQQHLKRKQQAREQKEADKQEALKDPTKHVVTVDLQAVLQAPCGLVSQLYYKRKLSVYNFTVYSLADGKGTCFIWDETEGMRGSCEIATCLVMYLRSLPRTVKEVTIYSDCCGGQNRNQNLTAALIHAVNTIPNIEVINQKYLETGHTQMECDSMHASISYAKKNTPIFVPSEWDIVLRLARRGKKYTVIPLKHTSIYDFKVLAASTIRNTKTDINGQKVNWLQIRFIQLHKGQEDLMYFKNGFDEDGFRTLRLTGSSKRSRPAPPKTLPLRYSSKLPISKPKHNDLMSLCHSGIIPEHHHHFFKSLPVSLSAKDRLPAQDKNDSTGSETD